MSNNLKNIYIIGLVLNHQSLYESIIKLFSRKKINIIFITKQQIIKNLSEVNKNIKYIIYDNNTKDLKILYKSLKILSYNDIIILDEIYNYNFSLFFLSLKKYNIYYIVHDYNKYFRNIIFLSLKSLYFKLIINYIKKCIKKYIFISPIIFNNNLIPNNKYFFLPFDFDDQFNKSNFCHQFSPTNILITIPGNIDQRKRFYSDFFDFLIQYYQKNKNSKIIFCFLGKMPKGLIDIIINKLPINSIIYFDKYIDQNLFDSYMRRSNYLLSITNLFLNNLVSYEIYGLTKETGITYLSYKWEKPLIIHYLHNIIFELNSQMLIYKNYELLENIITQIEQKKLVFNYNISYSNKLLFNKEILFYFDKFYNDII